jgi:hypothetical protein
MKRSVCLATILFLTFLASAQPSDNLMLRVAEVETGREVAAVSVVTGEDIEVEYTHSMYGVRQKEVFSIGHDGCFRLLKMVFGSMAAAVYYDPDPGQSLIYKDNVWVLKRNGENYQTLRYRVSPGTGHVLKARNRTIDLSGQSDESGRLIEIALDKRGPT